MSNTSQNFRLFHMSNFSFQNLRSFLLMQPGYQMVIGRHKPLHTRRQRWSGPGCRMANRKPNKHCRKAANHERTDRWYGLLGPNPGSAVIRITY